MINIFTDLKRELVFQLRQKNVLALLLFVFGISVFSVITGMLEINKQQATIERLIKFDQIDREEVLEKYSGYGLIAYYSRHLTYASPSTLAFSAIGQRDVMPWKHRVKMLALEGQIYETDADNPELAYVGRIDFAFLISVLAPLFVILLLHDVRAAERANGRYDLLLITSNRPNNLWLMRIIAGILCISVVLLVPFIIGAVISGSGFTGIVSVSLICIAQVTFWAFACHWLGKVPTSAPQIASMLLGIWLLTTVIIPTVGEKYLAHAIEGPKGGDIVLAQREAVNVANELPYESTFTPFIERHPQWREYTDMPSGFAWKWYYAYQQVGDQNVETMSQAYRDTIIQKNKIAGYIAWLSPAMLAQRWLTQVADTDTMSMLKYEQSIRDFHAELRHFYYPFLFYGQEYDKADINKRPEFTPLTF